MATLAEFSANDIFGEMALIDNEPRSATAIAVTDVELVGVSERQFLFMVGQTPYLAALADKKLQHISSRLIKTAPRTDALAAPPVPKN